MGLRGGTRNEDTLVRRSTLHRQTALVGSSIYLHQLLPQLFVWPAILAVSIQDSCKSLTMKWFWICLRPLTGRFLHSIITLWLITVLFFLLVELIPGDFATATATRDTTWEQIQTTRYQLDLFTSVPERYLQWLLGLLSGDLGTSWWVQKPITPLIAKRLWHSTWLVAWATALAIPLALSLALLAVAWRGRIFDRLSSIVGLTAISFPDFLVAYGLMALLAVYFDVFPVHTTYILDMPLADRLHATGLPILSLAAITITPIFRQSRAALINVLSAENIQMAELKGLSRWRILLWHALPNAAAPIANSIVLAVANLFVGLVIIETIFSYPGMGHMLITVVLLRDIPLVLACALITAVLYIGLILLADAIGILANPRLRYPLIPTGGRWFARRPQGKIIAAAPRPAALAAVLALLVVAGAAITWMASGENEVEIVAISAPTGDVREKLTVTALFGDNPDLSNPIHYAYFMPFGVSQRARHTLQGELRVPRFKVRRRWARETVSTVEAFFPAFKTRLVSHDDVLLTMERDRMLKASSGAWYVILSPGRVWHEPADGDWSRGSFPFTLTGLTHNATYYGVATFLFNDQTMSEIRVQIAQETANWAQYDMWGQSAVTFTPGPIAGAQQARDDYARKAANRLAVRPWSELAAMHWRSLESFDGECNRHNITVSGLMVDDVFYLRTCRTRAGPHPYCREMRHGVFSVAKTLGAAVSMLWLAQRFGPEVFDEKIGAYKP